MNERHYARLGGSKCPACGSSEITGGAWNADSGYATQDAVCDTCHAAWKDEYQLSGYTGLEEGKVKMEQGAKEHSTEILLHDIHWHLVGEDAPQELDEANEEYIRESIIKGIRAGELIVHKADADGMWRGWWSI